MNDFFIIFLSPVKGHFQNVCYLYTVYELIWYKKIIINQKDKNTHCVSSIIKDSELNIFENFDSCPYYSISKNRTGISFPICHWVINILSH